MTIASTATRKEYVGNGVTTAFPFPYQFRANTDLVFWERTIARREQKDGDFRHAQALMVARAALEDAREVARAYADQARVALGIFEPGPWRNALENLAFYSV